MPDGVSETSRRAWLLPAVWLLLLLSVLAAAFGLFFVAVSDAEPPDDWDLILETASVPDRLNGFVDHLEVKPITDRWSSETRKRVRELTSDPHPDLASAREMLVQGREILDAFRRCCAKPRFVVPDGQDASYCRLKTMTELASIEANVLFLEGRHEEAIDLAVDIVRFGDRVQRDGNEFLWITGCCLKWDGTLRLQAFLDQCLLGTERFAAYADDLSMFDDPSRIFADCMKRQYSETIRLIDQVSEGEKHVSWITGTHATVSRLPFASKLLLKRNRTKEKLAAQFRPYVRSAGMTYRQMDRGKGEGGTDSPWWANISNFVGEKLDNPLCSINWFRSYCDDICRADCIRLLFALRAFHSSHGRFPLDLGELVPEFIDEVPIDPYAGRPYRYCPEAGIIYSIGEDLIDSGGSTGSSDWQEPTFRFASPVDRPTDLSTGAYRE